MDALLLLLATEEVAKTIQTEAKDVLSATSTPLALVTGTLIAGATTALKASNRRTLKSAATALVASLAALAVTIVLIIVMWDVFWRSFDDGLDAVLVGYWIAAATVIGVAGYVLVCLIPPAFGELRTAASNWNEDRKAKKVAAEAAKDLASRSRIR